MLLHLGRGFRRLGRDSDQANDLRILCPPVSITGISTGPESILSKTLKKEKQGRTASHGKLVDGETGLTRGWCNKGRKFGKNQPNHAAAALAKLPRASVAERVDYLIDNPKSTVYAPRSTLPEIFSPSRRSSSSRNLLGNGMVSRLFLP